jgi:hypothetical protein
MDKYRAIPGSQRMCASLHRNSTFAAHGAHQPPGRAAFRGAVRRSARTGAPERCRVSSIRSGPRLILEAVPPDQPRITVKGPRSRTATSPDLPSALQQGPSHPRETRDRPSPNQPHPIRSRRAAPRHGQAARRSLGPTAPFEGIHRISMTKPTMTTQNPAIPMARTHPFRGASPWPNQPRTGQGTRAMPVAPSCPLPRRTAGGPGRPAPTWEELLGQR